MLINLTWTMRSLRCWDLLML